MFIIINSIKIIWICQLIIEDNFFQEEIEMGWRKILMIFDDQAIELEVGDFLGV